MKKAVVVVAALLVILVGAGAVAVPFAEDYAARHIKAGLAQNGLEVESVKVHLLERSIAIDKIASLNGSVKIGGWKVEGLVWPFEEIRQGRLPLDGLNWGDPLKADRLHLSDVRLADPDEGGAWTIKEVVATGLDLPRYDPVYDGPFRSQVLTARLLRALSAKQIEQTELAHISIDETSVAARKLVVADYVQGLIGKLDVEEAKAGSTGAKSPELTLGELRASRIDLRRSLDLASSIDWEPGMPIGRVPVGFAELSGFGGNLMTQYGLSLGKITIETTAESRDISRSRLRVEGFVLAPSWRSVQAMATRMVLQAMNLDAVRLDFDCSAVDDRARHELRVDDCKLGGPNLADLSFTARLVDIDEEFWEAVDFGEVYALLGTKAALAAAKLTIADKGLLQRSLQAKAKLGGKDAAAERAELANEIRRHQPHGVLITQDMTKLLDTVARFVEQGGTLTLDTTPQPALGLDKLEYLGRPGADLVNALGLTATLSR
ncbi:hypothetical protein [Reyranella sp.]|uniref:hypothetical protein n=1 Tax=Reyranella sp. TaxID=1929291 RepID=UPI001224EDC0|nr:hypothetical protein [Reyranella sp.]TAJ84907.1 MAG: hypothetical protein EPO50_17275 [Reyranella sp.]